MSKKVNINIQKEETIFIDGKSGKELTKKEWQQKYGKVKSGLQDKNVGGDVIENGTATPTEDVEGTPKENS